jgi:hypothetical protein
MMSVHTGMRISDVVTFDITKRLQANDILIRIHKTGKELFTWIQDWLVERLRAHEKQQGPLIFEDGQSNVVMKEFEVAAGGWLGQTLAPLEEIFELSQPLLRHRPDAGRTAGPERIP